VLQQAGMLAFRDTFMMVAIGCLLALLPVLILRGRSRP
jgi:hypothetical protein